MTTTDITVFEKISADVEAAEPARPKVLLYATALISTAVILGFTSLVGFYLAERADYLAQGLEEPWLPGGTTIPLTQPNFMLLTVGLSAVTMLWAIQAVGNNDRANAFIALGLTLLFGFAQITQTFFLLSIMELELASDGRAALLYSVIGAQIALMGAAMIYLTLTGLRTLGGNYSSKDYEGVVSAGMFWTVSALMYVLVWYAVYITK